MKAYWKKGSQHATDASKAYAELERIREKEGCLVPAVVVAAASKPRNPLHKEFEWDDSAAAGEYRLEQARRMLRSLEVVYEASPDKQMRVYEVVTQPAHKDMPERKVYDDVGKILADPALRDELLARAIQEAISYRRKYSQLQELSLVFAAFDKFLMEAKI